MRTNFCNIFIAVETVGCTSGAFPGNTPPPNSDGTCQTKRNGLFASLQPSQHVSCGCGNLPDLRQKPNPDGNCRKYTAKKDDFCASIVAKKRLMEEDPEKYNKKTLGWNGCKLLWSDVNMCFAKEALPYPHRCL
ncbi:glycoside hydrolase family 18 protein [Colletotrichum incanum]|uniref:Glycoside hydrolase family 18 protein n=1 Tax=Colletotrichum incanum TaxID=1573173 RepID=A0A162PK31_COLIC|nr:glycoside hydrolase family 18 protein [Colletotrichum incanum]